MGLNEKFDSSEAGVGTKPSARVLMESSLTIAAFLALNATLNMTNRWVLGVYGFKFPIFLTMAHLAFGFIALAPVMALPQFANRHESTLRSHWKGIACVGAFKVANIVANNASLVLISLSLNQIIRSGIPIVTAFVGIMIEKTVPTGFEVLSLVILTVGVVLSIWEGSISGSTMGMSIAVASTFCGAAMLSFSGKVLKEDIDVIRLTFYTAPVSVIILVPFFLAKELQPLLAYWSHLENGMVVAYLLLGGLNAVLYNMTHYRVIQITSSTATPVIGMIKVVGVVVLSAFLLGESSIFTVRMVVGCTLAVLGFTMYSYASIEARRRKNPTVYMRQPDASDAAVRGSKAGTNHDEMSSPLLRQQTGPADV
ncbi:g11507 [Coccomyxa elongata]